MRIRAFQGLRPTVSAVEKVASLPYDVVTTEEARELAQDNPLSMLHVVRAEIDLPEDADPYSDEVYARAVANFEGLQQEGHLVRENEPCIYLYRQQMGDHVQTGLVAVCSVEDYENGSIKKHENTRKDKEDDRTRLTSDLSANAGPVFLTYRDNEAINELSAAITSGEPLYDFTAEDGIRHSAWRVAGGADFVKSFENVPCFYVADGHHRTASAARVGKERKEANPNHDGSEDYNWFLSVLFPASELKILPYNRLMSDLNGQDAATVLARIREACPVVEDVSPEPANLGEVSFYLDGRWYGLTLEAEAEADPVSRLDMSVLQAKVLGPIFGIEDQRTSKRIDFIGGIRGTGFLKKQVDAGKAAAAFSMYPVSVEQLMDIADAGQNMPPKTTWFEPKLRSGLFVHTFEK